jgi:HK97 gp10 family phage protein
VKIDVDFGELTKFAAALRTDAAVASGRVERAVAASTNRLEAQATSAAPVLTGELRSSISADQSGLARRVMATARAAFYQEYGTSVMPPQPFLMVYADSAHADLEREIARAKWGVSV